MLEVTGTLGVERTAGMRESIIFSAARWKREKTVSEAHVGTEGREFNSPVSLGLDLAEGSESKICDATSACEVAASVEALNRVKEESL